MSQLPFKIVIDQISKTMKVITNKKSNLTFGLIRTLWKFHTLAVIKSLHISQFKFIAAESKQQKRSYLAQLYYTLPDNIPLWLLEYQEFYNAVKDTLYIKMQGHAALYRANPQSILSIFKVKVATRSINIDGHLTSCLIVFKEDASSFIKKMLNKHNILDVSIIVYRYRSIAVNCGFNQLGSNPEHYIVDPVTQHLLKPDTRNVNKLLKFFKEPDTNKKNAIYEPNQISVSNYIQLLNTFSHVTSKVKIRGMLSGAGRIYYLTIDQILDMPVTTIQKIVEARYNKINCIKYYDHILVFDPDEIDKNEQKLLDKIMNKDLKEFIQKMKSLDTSKKINESVIKRLNISGLRANLYEHQKVAVSWLEKLYQQKSPGAILADKMGAGKTLQTISFMSLHPYDRYIIIAPASVVGVWEQEIIKFNPNLGKRIGKSIKIMSYERAMSSKPESTDILILDEAQKIKNNQSLTFKIISAIKKKFVIITTGTPIENKIDDLFSLLQVINPSAYDILNIFRRLYKKDQEKLVKVVRSFIEPIFIQRDISQKLVKGKLKIIEEMITPQPIEVQLLKEVIAVYKDKMLKLQASNNHDFYNAQEILIGLLRLRQAISYPMQLPEDLIVHLSPKVQNAIHSIVPSKTINLLKICDKVKKAKEKIVIFTEFKGTMQYLKTQLEKKGMNVLTLSGEDSSMKRKIMISNFQNEDTYNAFIIALKAGNSGITLTAANNVYIYDLFWNPAVLAQAVARVHRIGQDSNVNAYFSILKNTFDEHIYNTIIKKKQLINTFEGNISDETSKPDTKILDVGSKIFGIK